MLEPGRSLTLAEKGGAGAELLVAHPAFRIVATMNPGGGTPAAGGESSMGLGLARATVPSPCGCTVPPCTRGSRRRIGRVRGCQWEARCWAAPPPAGGDYGKKELSPALSNRFTSIWVPAIEDGAELLAILESRLPGEAGWSGALDRAGGRRRLRGRSAQAAQPGVTPLWLAATGICPRLFLCC